PAGRGAASASAPCAGRATCCCTGPGHPNRSADGALARARRGANGRCCPAWLDRPHHGPASTDGATEVRRRAVLAMRVDGSAQDTERTGGGVGGWSLHRIGPQGGRVARLVVVRFDDGVRPSHRRTATSRDGRSTMRERNHGPPPAVSAAMDPIRRSARLAAALLTLAVVFAACAVGAASSTVPVAPSASAPRYTRVTAPPADPSSDPSVEPPVCADAG